MTGRNASVCHAECDRCKGPIPWERSRFRTHTRVLQSLKEKWGSVVWRLCKQGGYLCCHSSASWLGIEPVAPAVDAWSLKRWTAREVPGASFHMLSCYPRIFFREVFVKAGSIFMKKKKKKCLSSQCECFSSSSFSVGLKIFSDISSLQEKKS